MVVMKKFSAIFTIINEKNCPLYEKGERLSLSEKTVACPEGKEMCLILVRDMTELLFQLMPRGTQIYKEYAESVFNCSGCTGLIKFALCQQTPNVAEDAKEGAVARIDSTVKKLYGRIINSNLLRSLPPEKVELILAQFKEIDIEAGALLIRKGEQNLNLYLVVSGQLLVEDAGIQLDILGEGELCGEMSYLGADIAVSTVRALTSSKVLAIPGDVFGRLLGDSSAVQTYMAKLLAERLRKSNSARTSDFDACMSGRLDEILPAELLQIFHMHQKTGTLAMDFISGKGRVSFREGCIINASYENKTNEEAIFAMLAERTGIYRFTTGLSPSEMKAAEIGDFMMLLMEGVKRVDEEREKNPKQHF